MKFTMRDRAGQNTQPIVSALHEGLLPKAGLFLASPIIMSLQMTKS
jgi:hypothetical protein